jgi:hypothetical protein
VRTALPPAPQLDHFPRFPRAYAVGFILAPFCD